MATAGAAREALSDRPRIDNVARHSLSDLVAKREAVAKVVSIPIERIVAELDGSITIAYPSPLSPIEQANLAAEIEAA